MHVVIEYTYIDGKFNVLAGPAGTKVGTGGDTLEQAMASAAVALQSNLRIPVTQSA